MESTFVHSIANADPGVCICRPPDGIGSVATPLSSSVDQMIGSLILLPPFKCKRTGSSHPRIPLIVRDALECDGLGDFHGFHGI